MKKVYNLIGLAHRAGKVSAGTMAAKTSLQRKRAYLLIMSKDISENSRDMIASTSEKQKIPWIVLGDKYELGTSVGKAYRVAVTVNDAGMAKAIVDALEAVGEVEKSMGVVEWSK
ncbi:MAG: ribosomal L7Ae/L30e/S12e/Gadd45 family protein [Bacillota bacterium]|nr:ribosomal L7Ae/L30e/S12e/Gadd45 family protein [Bacillota bacterium]